jgi:hypothetical protein
MYAVSVDYCTLYTPTLGVPQYEGSKRAGGQCITGVSTKVLPSDLSYDTARRCKLAVRRLVRLCSEASWWLN